MSSAPFILTTMENEYEYDYDYAMSGKPVAEQLKSWDDFFVIKTRKVSGGIEMYDHLCFDRLKICELLKSLGFFRYDMPDGTEYKFVHIENKQVELVEQARFVDAIEDYIKTLEPKEYLDITTRAGENLIVTPEMLLSAFYRDKDWALGASDRLRPEKKIEFMQDTAETKWLYFKNCVVAVHAGTFERIEYTDAKLDKYIWKSNIIDRDFIYLPIPENGEEGIVGDFEKFCFNICGKDRERFMCLQTIIGYLMHDFYERDLFAVLFTDVNDGDAQKSAGGTGKGLIGRALAQVLNREQEISTKYVAIAGKGFDHDSGNGTCYALADISTQLIHLEDVDKKFDMHCLYGDITDGCKMRKNFDRKPTVRMCKFMISVNHTLNISDESTKRRIILFELANFYNATHRPEQDFGGVRFFSNKWDWTDWSAFYSFMVRCAAMYLKNDVRQPEMIHYADRRLEERFGRGFLDWIAEKLGEQIAASKTYVVNKGELYKEFDEEYPGEKTRPKFVGQLKSYLDDKGIPYIETRGGKNKGELLTIYPVKEIESGLQYEQGENKIPF